MAHYHGKEGLPELPVFGMRFIMPTKAVGYCYEGLSGETYPDRMAGGIYGRYEVEGLPVTPYLVPQECGMHMETECVTVYRKDTLNNSDTSEETFGLTFRACGESLGFLSPIYVRRVGKCNASGRTSIAAENRSLHLRISTWSRWY